MKAADMLIVEVLLGVEEDMRIGIGLENPATQIWRERTEKSVSLNLSGSSEINIVPITNVNDAEKIFGQLTELQLKEVKGIIKDYDFTSITQRELANVSQLLYGSSLISGEVHAELVRGNVQFNNSGKQINRDESFNALDFFAKQLHIHKDFAAGEGRNGYSETSGGYDVAKNIATIVAQANQVVNALSYFSNSSSAVISIREKA